MGSGNVAPAPFRVIDPAGKAVASGIAVGPGVAVIMTVTGVPATILVTSIGGDVTTTWVTPGAEVAAGAQAPSAKTAATAAESTVARCDRFILLLLLGFFRLGSVRRLLVCYSSRI